MAEFRKKMSISVQHGMAVDMSITPKKTVSTNLIDTQFFAYVSLPKRRSYKYLFILSLICTE